MADGTGYIRVEGFGLEIQPGSVTVVSIEDRQAASTAAADAIAAKDQAVAAKNAALVARDEAVEAAQNAPGLPPGGNAGQVLVKITGEDRDTGWADQSGGGGTGLSTYGQVTALPGYPASFPAAPHNHTPTDINGSTALGRALITAADAQAARSAIQAAPSSTVSFPGFGTTAAVAAQGNHAHNASQIAFTSGAGGVVASNVQDAIVAAAAMGGGGGGGGGTSATVDVLYSSGGYPLQAASAPAGVKIRHFYGPTQYTGSTWAGVLDLYTYAELT